MLFIICYKYVKQKLYNLKIKIMEKFNGEQTEPIKITTAVEDIIEVIKRNETSEVKADLLLVAEDKMKKEEYQRFNAYRIGKIEVITEMLQKKSFEVKELFEQLKEIDVMGGD
jgi:biotin synthase-related radical SAM superfamily protein